MKGLRKWRRTILSVMFVEREWVVAVHGRVRGEDNALQAKDITKVARAALIGIHEICILIEVHADHLGKG